MQRAGGLTNKLLLPRSMFVLRSVPLLSLSRPSPNSLCHSFCPSLSVCVPHSLPPSLPRSLSLSLSLCLSLALSLSLSLCRPCTWAKKDSFSKSCISFRSACVLDIFLKTQHVFTTAHGRKHSFVHQKIPKLRGFKTNSCPSACTLMRSPLQAFFSLPLLQLPEPDPWQRLCGQPFRTTAAASAVPSGWQSLGKFPAEVCEGLPLPCLALALLAWKGLGLQ